MAIDMLLNTIQQQHESLIESLSHQFSPETELEQYDRIFTALFELSNFICIGHSNHYNDSYTIMFESALYTFTAISTLMDKLKVIDTIAYENLCKSVNIALNGQSRLFSSIIILKQAFNDPNLKVHNSKHSKNLETIMYG